MGPLEGKELGRELVLGKPVGDNDDDGIPDGAVLGSELGIAVGSEDGKMLGTTVGLAEGVDDGTSVGKLEGT